MTKSNDETTKRFKESMKNSIAIQENYESVLSSKGCFKSEEEKGRRAKVDVSPVGGNRVGNVLESSYM